MSPVAVATTMYRVEKIEEPFYRYALTWDPDRIRTDSPDLISLFRAGHEGWIADAWQAWDEETLAVHADLAEASFRTLPAD